MGGLIFASVKIVLAGAVLLAVGSAAGIRALSGKPARLLGGLLALCALGTLAGLGAWGLIAATLAACGLVFAAHAGLAMRRF